MYSSRVNFNASIITIYGSFVVSRLCIPDKSVTRLETCAHQTLAGAARNWDLHSVRSTKMERQTHFMTGLTTGGPVKIQKQKLLKLHLVWMDCELSRYTKKDIKKLNPLRA